MTKRILILNDDGTAEVNGVKVRVVPVEPTPELLRSMAIRRDHGLGSPGYYDNIMFAHSGLSHQKRMYSAMRDMRQLHEEVVGTGFYAAAIDLSSLPVVPERLPIKQDDPLFIASANATWNAALDAMGVKK